jgi:hypothetical protein
MYPRTTKKSDFRMIRFLFERHDVKGNRVAGENGFAISAYKIGAVCQEAFVKTADRIGALHGLDAGEKINS